MNNLLNYPLYKPERGRGLTVVGTVTEITQGTAITNALRLGHKRFIIFTDGEASLITNNGSTEYNFVW